MPAILTTSKLSAAVGGKSAKKLYDSFGFETVGDLLRHYPRTYVKVGDASDLERLSVGEHVTVVGRVVSSEVRAYEDRRTGRTAYRLEAVVRTADTDLHLAFFDRHAKTASWRQRRLEPDSYGLFSGKVDRFRTKLQLVHPKFSMFSDDHEDPETEAAARLREVRRFRPIYPATALVQSWDIEEAVGVTLRMLRRVPDVVPGHIRERNGLLTPGVATEWIHRPDNWSQVTAARQTLKFEEAFTTQVVLAQRRWSLSAAPARPRPGRDDGLLAEFDRRLPFELTAGQQRVSAEILDELAAEHPMHRLLQGEVGSGKTVVALRAMLQVVDAGGQAALLAPTEVLAQQHHRSVTAMLGDLAAGGMLGGAENGTRVVLITGSMTAAARKQALLDAASGAAGIVIGTHALLEETVQFADLGLVVVDEQHRFGVEQRAALTAKAGDTPPHVLVMTATPIPRTVAMTVFGDLETSVLSELPAGRAPIQTSVVPMRYKPAWLDRAWERVREEVGRGRQAYVVCPRIGDEDPAPPADDDAVVIDLASRRRIPAPAVHDEPPVDGLAPAAVDQVAPLLAAGALQGLRVEALHGRMAPDSKDRAMRGFAAGDIDVLVSTTVIEVGVDVPNASVMVVLDADRFGVSQLHQLRGRVGRGGHPGLCLLVTRAETGTKAMDRLQAVAGTTDGFLLSQVDLEQRREGDVLGASQSGLRSGLRLLSVIDDEEVIRAARTAATEVVAVHPDLGGHPDLAAAVAELNSSEQADYLEKG